MYIIGEIDMTEYKALFFLLLLFLNKSAHGMETPVEKAILKKLQYIDKNVKITPAEAGKIIGEKEFLDITKNEPLLFVPFKDLIEKKIKKGEKYIVAVITTKERARSIFDRTQRYRHQYYDANGFNRFLFEHSTVKTHQYKFNRYNEPDQNKRFYQFVDPFVKTTIQHKIKYFTIEGIIEDGNIILDDTFTFFCTDLDLFHDPLRKNFLRTYFFANQDFKKDIKWKNQEILLSIFLNKEKTEQAKKVMRVIVEQDDDKKLKATAQYHFAIMLYKQGDIEQSKNFMRMAAEQNDDKDIKVEAQNQLDWIQTK